MGKFWQRLNWMDWLILVFLSTLCYLVFFNHLGDYSLRMWDEARNAQNALEMLRNGNFLVAYFDGLPDMWNTKPPLFIWLVALFFKFFGANELALRLPSAIAASVTTVTIYLFARYWLKNRWVGILASLILLSSMGFSDLHIGRTGDFDAVLTVWSFVAAVSTFIYVESGRKQWLLSAFIFWTMAVMTKGVAGLFLLPGVAVYILWRRKFRAVVLNRYFWLGALGFFLVIAGFYLGRNWVNPGYWVKVWQEELFGRFGHAVGATDQNFWYYWEWWKNFRFQKWVYLVPVSIAGYFLAKKSKAKNLVIYLYVLTAGYFLIISASASKQLWYDAQLYPLASLLVSLFIITLISKFPLLLRPVLILVLCFYLQRYVRTNIAYIYRPDLEKANSCLQYGYTLRDNPDKFKGYVGVDSNADFCIPFHFFMQRENMGYKPVEKVQVKDNIFTCDANIVKQLETTFKTKRTFDNSYCWGVKIRG